MLEQLMNVNPVEIVIVVAALIILAGPVINTIMDSLLGIKEKLVDRKAKRIIDAALNGDESLREEIARQFSDASAEHDEFRAMFANDKRRLDQITREVENIRDRIDGQETRLDRHETQLDERAKGEKVIISSLKAILNEKIGMGSVSDLVDAVAQIDDFLIDGRK